MRQDIHNSDIPEVCRSCEARHRGICGALSVKQLIALNKKTTRKAFDAGTTLIHEAEPVSVYSNVIRGVVKLSKLLADGRQQIVGLQFAPDFLGRPLRGDSQTGADAATGVELCSFPKTTLEQLMAEAPELEHRLLEQSLKELDEARNWMVTLGRKTAPEKVADFLLMIALHSDPDVDGRGQKPLIFDLPLSRADIADFLGLTIETVSRQLTRLRKQGIIDIEHNRHVTLHRVDQLRAASGA
ncbi:MAG: Crp/Fnr family transcriptional regulator [Pseudomonadota bacterium]